MNTNPPLSVLNLKLTKSEVDFYSIWAERVEVPKEELIDCIMSFTVLPPTNLENRLLWQQIQESKPKKSEVSLKLSHLLYLPQTLWIKLCRLKGRVLAWINRRFGTHF